MIRKLLVIATLLVVAVLRVNAAQADTQLDRHCNPYTYGRLHSCHVAPVENLGRWLLPCGHVGPGATVCTWPRPL